MVGGGGQFRGLGKPLKLKKKVDIINNLTWPQNARNPVSIDVSFKDFLGEDAPSTPTGMS